MSRTSRIGVALALMLCPSGVQAQIARDSAVDWLVSAGSEAERYLRVLQIAGVSRPIPWSVRPFSANVLREIAPNDSAQPWRSGFIPRREGSGMRVIEPELVGILNTTYPYGFNDGPIWAGRGLTLAASAGVRGQLGPLSFVLAPQVFRAQNAAFPLAPNGRTGPQAFGDAYSGGIDLPQRFGNRAYQRVDPGQSVVQLSALRLTAGVSTGNEYWGPASENPFLLGNNASGFVHAFAGTDGPLSLGPARLSVRFLAGRLDQSAFSYADSASARRYISGVVVAVGVTQLPGLEVGGGRLFENTWPDTGFGFGDVIRPLFQNLLSSSLATKLGNNGSRPDNQLASLFARWAFPRSGVEVYGEYGREDNSWDMRDLLLEPDHDVVYMLGLARVWRQSADRWLVLRGELVNGASTALSRVRNETPSYVHTPVVQGHTQLGQVLGAPAVYGGGGTSVIIDYYVPRGRLSFGWRRMMREPPSTTSSPRDVMHALTMDAILFRSRVDLAPEVTLVYNADRNGGGGVMNARGAVTARAHW